MLSATHSHLLLSAVVVVAVMYFENNDDRLLVVRIVYVRIKSYMMMGKKKNLNQELTGLPDLDPRRRPLARLALLRRWPNTLDSLDAKSLQVVNDHADAARMCVYVCYRIGRRSTDRVSTIINQ